MSLIFTQFPNCCKAQIIYNFGFSSTHRYQGQETPESVKKTIESALKSGGNYVQAFYIAILDDGSRNAYDAVLKEIGFHHVASSKGYDDHKLFTYIYSSRLDKMEEDEKPEHLQKVKAILAKAAKPKVKKVTKKKTMKKLKKA